MALSLKNMGQAAIGTGSPTTFYTNSSGGNANLVDILVVNTTAAAITVQVWSDSDGTAATDAELLFGKNISVPANDQIHFTGQHIIQNTGTLKAQAASSGLVLTATGYEGVA